MAASRLNINSQATANYRYLGQPGLSATRHRCGDKGLMPMVWVCGPSARPYTTAVVASSLLLISQKVLR